jgi:type IV pilus assembly protein PilQ
MKKFLLFLAVIILTALFYPGMDPFCANNFLVLDSITASGSRIDIHTTGQAKYNVFKISNPPRLVVELFNVEQDLKQKEINVGGAIIKRIRSGQFQNEPVKIARVVIELTKQSEYSASQKGGNIFITLQQDAGVPQTARAASLTVSTVTTKAEKSRPKKQLKPTSISVSTAAVKQAVAPVAKKTIRPAVATAGKQEIIASTITVKAQKEPAVSSAPVSAAPPKITPRTPKAVPAPASKVVQAQRVEPKRQAAQKHAPVAKAPKKSDMRVIGNITLPKTPVTMEYQDADIQDVLQVLSLRSGINIIAGVDVTGTISISLKDVPFDQAFNTILTIKGLTSLAIGDNILQVITPAALTSQRQQEIVFTRVYPLNYAESPIIAAQIKSVFGSEGLKGDVNTDARTNSLLVSASLEGHAAVEKILKEIDIKPLQVMIESRVVDVNISDASELGVSWTKDNIIATGAGAVATAARTQTAQPGGGPSVSITQPGQSGQNITVSGAQSAMAVPTQGGLSFAFGYINNTDILSARLGVLATEGRVKLLSNPKVTTVNNKEARIMVGDKIPYKTTTIGQGGVSQENFTYIDAGIELTVLPTISPDKWITLKVRPIVSVPLVAPAGQAPTVRTRETDVTVMVKDGDTIVIGGLISDSEIEQMEKVPILGDIPFFGALFKHKSHQKTRSELLIFITPKILEG